MKKKIRIVVALVIIIIAATISVIFALRPDQFHTSERRIAKDRMITEIRSQVKQINPKSELEGTDWWNGSFIQLGDGSWIAYRAQCHKVDPKVYDLFVGRGSDGSWYYSTYHFCIGMMMLQGEEQVGSLQEFASRYALERFDGLSDQALLPTWPTRSSKP